MPEEIKKKAEEIKNELETAKKEAKAAKEKAEALSAELKETKSALEYKGKKIDEQAEQIDNLDKSFKSQQETIENLRKIIRESPATFSKKMREELEEKKSMIEESFKKTDRFTVELKIATTDLTPQTGSQYTGTAMDPNIQSVPMLGNAFILAFGTKDLTSSRIAWVESTVSKNVGYVKELAANSNKTTITFNEKYRKPAKIATYMEISSEFENWFETLYNFCIDEGQRLIMKDADAKIWSGAGNDTSKQDEVYGLKTQATAFSKVATYDSPTVADVIFDAIAQVKKAGYAANVAIVSYGTMAKLQGLKDSTGNYMFDKVNGKLQQVRVLESDQLTDDEMLVADSSCADIYFGTLYELEFTRQASTDSWRVDYRRYVQVKVTAPKKKGLIYVANIDTAITSITAAAASSVSES